MSAELRRFYAYDDTEDPDGPFVLYRDAEKMRDERDAAIRRASDLTEKLAAIEDIARYRTDDTAWHDVRVIARAALRSQESQKPPETENRP